MNTEINTKFTVELEFEMEMNNLSFDLVLKWYSLYGNWSFILSSPNSDLIFSAINNRWKIWDEVVLYHWEQKLWEIFYSDFIVEYKKKIEKEKSYVKDYVQ